MEPTFTVLTPTFNRERTLGRVHASLEAQSFRDFEWLVVDDGSSDGTESLVRDRTGGSSFPIVYLRQPNRGKHMALNRGVEHARGRFCAVLDSDDWYRPEALERLLAAWASIPEPGGFAGVEARCAYGDGSLIGDRLPCQVLDSDMYELRYLHGIRGDTIGMVRTDVLRRYPFPEREGFVTEARVLNRIAQHHRTRFISEVLAHKEYVPGGITNEGTTAAGRIRRSQLSVEYITELLALGRPMRHGLRYRAYANLVRNSLHGERGWGAQRRSVPSSGWWLAAAPAGLLLYLRDRRALARTTA